jgi:effector-binding domain-containing protein
MTTTSQPAVKEIAWAEKTFLGVHSTQAFSNLSTFFTQSYGALYHAAQEQKLMLAEPPYAIYYSVDEAKGETELVAAISVPDKNIRIDGFETITLPACKAITITHIGSYDTMHTTYALLEDYLKEHGLKRTWMLEQYLSDPEIEKDPATWQTNIYFGVA